MLRGVKSPHSNYKNWLSILLLLLAIFGGVVILVVTRWGIGASPDSVYYLGAAQNISAGRWFSLPSTDGTFNPITRWPPFYSWVLAILSQTGLGIHSAARWLNALLTAANILLLGVILFPYVKRGSAAAVVILGGGLLMLVSPTFLEIHLMAWSEPLFIFLGISGLWVLGSYLDGNRFFAMLLAALLVGLAFLTRFAGAALVATGMVGLLLFTGTRWLRRISYTLIFGFVCSLPILVWVVSNFRAKGEVTSREFNFHPIGVAHLKSVVNTFSSWLLISENAPGLLKLGSILCVLLAFGSIYYVTKQRSSDSEWERRFLGVSGIPGFIKLFALFIPTYLGFLFVSISLFDANTPLDARILSPVFVTGMVLFLGWLLIWWQTPESSKGLKILIWIVGSILFIGYLVQGIGPLSNAYREGIGFNSLAWRHSATIAELNTFPPEVLLYTNMPEAILLHTGRAVNGFPTKFFSSDQMVNENYLAELEGMEKTLRERGGYIIYFNRLNSPALPSEKELNELLALRLLDQFEDGAIYQSAQAR